MSLTNKQQSKRGEAKTATFKRVKKEAAAAGFTQEKGEGLYGMIIRFCAVDKITEATS